MAIEAEIPLFPLSIVLFPNTIIPLHIFEPRYKEMIRYCMETDEVFGIIYLNDAKFSEVGCTARIKKLISTHEDGSMDILVEGELRFKLLDIKHEKSYLTAVMRPIPEPLEIIDDAKRSRLIAQHMKWLDILNLEIRPQMYNEVRYVSYLIAQNTDMSFPEKQKLLQYPTENGRVFELIKYFEKTIPKTHDYVHAKKLIESDGHYQAMPPSLDINLGE